MSDDQRKKFIAAFDSYAKDIYRYCYYRVYSPTAAEECMQETYLNAWHYLSQGKKIRNIRSFLYRISRNLIVDAHRKKITHNQSPESLDQLLLEPGRALLLSYDGRDEIEQNILRQEILDIIKRLPPDYQEILLLRFEQELMPREISKMLNKSANAVSAKLHRAVQELKHQISLLESRKPVEKQAPDKPPEQSATILYQ